MIINVKQILVIIVGAILLAMIGNLPSTGAGYIIGCAWTWVWIWCSDHIEIRFKKDEKERRLGKALARLIEEGGEVKIVEKPED